MDINSKKVLEWKLLRKNNFEVNMNNRRKKNKLWNLLRFKNVTIYFLNVTDYKYNLLFTVHQR